ncbi:hypothetical protein BaRGS_00020679 [Batillaria attramentaria]|uniref:Uncharacterized protein n=1 Tax=Batillaria attramentaria TaxID=370345 RepID=A0ABD0KM30_9CAEN
MNVAQGHAEKCHYVNTLLFLVASSRVVHVRVVIRFRLKPSEVASVDMRMCSTTALAFSLHLMLRIVQRDDVVIVPNQYSLDLNLS